MVVLLKGYYFLIDGTAANEYFAYQRLAIVVLWKKKFVRFKLRCSGIKLTSILFIVLYILNNYFPTRGTRNLGDNWFSALVNGTFHSTTISPTFIYWYIWPKIYPYRQFSECKFDAVALVGVLLSSTSLLVVNSLLSSGNSGVGVCSIRV